MDRQRYTALKKGMLLEYKSADTYQILYSISFLEASKNVERTDRDDFLEYCNTFNRIALHFIHKEMLTKYIAGVWFCQGLPRPVAKKVITKFGVDVDDPPTVKYMEFYKYVTDIATADNEMSE
jgi:hypothetical protein